MTRFCDLTQGDDGLYRCSRCPTVYHKPITHFCGTPGPWSTKGEEFAEIVDCRRRSAQAVRQIECQACGQRGVMAEVFACELHGECTTRYRRRDVRSCLGCDDYEA